MRVRTRRLLTALALLGAALLVNASGSGAHARRVTIQTRAVAPDGVRLLGPLSRSAAVRGAVVLRPRDDAALQAFIAAATNPGSRSFHHYLAPGTFAARFGPGKAALSAVRGQLRGDGLTVGQTSRDGLVVPFSGPAARVQTAFATKLGSYAMPNGSVAHAPTTSVSLPANVAGDVATVLGLNDIVREHRIGPPVHLHDARRAHPAARSTAVTQSAAGPSACAAATGAAAQFGGLTDEQIANAYGAGSLYAAGDIGAGQRIAVYELEPFARSDIRTFDTCYFGATRAARMQARLHLHPVDGGQPRGPGSGEASLDVEDLSALAPGAQIDVYAGPSPNANPNVYDAFDEYAAIVDDDADQVISTSWGLCEQAVQSGQQGLQEAENYIFQQAAAQGQTVFSAAGDNGSDDCNTRQTSTPAAGQNPVSVDDPASQPYVLGVGGTTIDAASTPPLQHVWNDGPAAGGGGGGISESWRMPSWQQRASLPGLVSPGDGTWRAANAIERANGYRPGFCQAHAPGASATTPCRLVPDVSAQGDEYAGAITVYSSEYVSRSTPSGWTTTGGTSSSAPIWAAMLALVNASPACRADRATAHGVGFAAPLLYRVASDPAAYGASFTDVRAGSNDTYGISNGTVFAATRGFDPATGLGSPVLAGPTGTAGLADHLCGLAPSPARPAVTALRPASGSAAGGERVTITGSGFAAHGRPQVASIQIGAHAVPASRFRVRGAHTIVATLPPARQGLPPAAHSSGDGAGPAQVIVTLRQGPSSAPSPHSRFTYVAAGGPRSAPTVAAVTPSGGLRTASGTVTVLGSGFAGVRSVSFGGVRARHITVHGPGRITVRYPPMTRATTCSRLPHSGVYAGENTRNDVCQVQVRVHTTHGISAPSRIRPPLEGPLWHDSMGVLLHPACGCEVTQASDEFDYLPRPRITSVSTSGGPASLASERGGSVITVRGAGLNPLDIDWADFGDPADASSVAVGYVYLSGTKMQIRAPRHEVTLGIASSMLSVKTLAGQSNAMPVRYAGLPVATRVINLANSTRIANIGGGPSTGGTPIEVQGLNFRGQILSLAILGLSPSLQSAGTQYRFEVTGDRALRTQTVAQNPGLVAVEPCTVTGCAKGSLQAGMLLYPPGAPTVTAVSPASGPAAGGTPITIAGHNLGCTLQVLVGGRPATGVASAKTIIGCGSTTTVTAITPAGVSGESAPVTVRTAAAAFTGRAGGSEASFSYR
ncbi:MAG TPA: IPT/TIG domain-containing protein [Solirubrobacteraceae bacterium]|nr:IPT/TIG domain-containing protein [Solirubrobacteraceae bacterium]